MKATGKNFKPTSIWACIILQLTFKANTVILRLKTVYICVTTKTTFSKFSRFYHEVPHAQELKLDKLAPDMAILVGAGDSPTGLAFL